MVRKAKTHLIQRKTRRPVLGWGRCQSERRRGCGWPLEPEKAGHFPTSGEWRIFGQTHRVDFLAFLIAGQPLEGDRIVIGIIDRTSRQCCRRAADPRCRLMKHFCPPDAQLFKLPSLHHAIANESQRE